MNGLQKTALIGIIVLVIALAVILFFLINNILEKEIKPTSSDINGNIVTTNQTNTLEKNLLDNTLANEVDNNIQANIINVLE